MQEALPQRDGKLVVVIAIGLSVQATVLMAAVPMASPELVVLLTPSLFASQRLFVARLGWVWLVVSNKDVFKIAWR